MQDEIVQKEDKMLRKIAKEVPIEEIPSRKIQTIINRMKIALNDQEDGVAIAAPQIGESWRIFVISKKIFEMIEEEKRKKESKKKSKRENLNEFENGNSIKEYKDMIFINPEIIKLSKKKTRMEEGCLSVRWLYGRVERSEKALVKAYDENGNFFTMGGTGLLAQAFQHETDHLNGVLFTDKASDLKEMPPQYMNHRV